MAPPTVEQVVSRDGTPIAVRRSGDGPPLVLVHGTTADHTRWAPVLPALEERFTVLVVVMPGQRHTAMQTAPELFTAEVLGFLADR